MTPIKDFLWLAETSLHWLWQIMMSNSDELRTGNIVYVSADRELKIDWNKSSPCNITFVNVDRELKKILQHWLISYVYFTGKIFVNFMKTAFNPFMPNGISHPYRLEQSISVLRGFRWYFSFLFLIENYASKQWRPWSDTAFCGVWSGSALFAYVPPKWR